MNNNLEEARKLINAWHKAPQPIAGIVDKDAVLAQVIAEALEARDKAAQMAMGIVMARTFEAVMKEADLVNDERLMQSLRIALATSPGAG
jgi:ABC-type sugar transport system substrate-binding protein